MSPGRSASGDDVLGPAGHVDGYRTEAAGEQVREAPGGVLVTSSRSVKTLTVSMTRTGSSSTAGTDHGSSEGALRPTVRGAIRTISGESSGERRSDGSSRAAVNGVPSASEARDCAGAANGCGQA